MIRSRCFQHPYRNQVLAPSRRLPWRQQPAGRRMQQEYGTPISKSFPWLLQGCDTGAKSNKGCSITSLACRPEAASRISGAASIRPQRLVRCPGTRLLIAAGRGRLCWVNIYAATFSLSRGRGTSGTRGPAVQTRAELSCCQVWVLPAGAQPR